MATRPPSHDIPTSTEEGALAAGWADFVHVGPWVIQTLGIRPNRPKKHQVVDTTDATIYPFYFDTLQEAVKFCRDDQQRQKERGRV